MANNRLVDFATKEAQLVWNRYGCMLVANSILLGFIGQLATQRCYEGQFGIWACVTGTIITFLWLFITSYGWSLSGHAFYRSRSSNEKDVDALEVYEKWKESLWIWKKLPYDPIWFLAHFAILVFCIAYIFLMFYFSTSRVWPYILLVVNVIVFVIWCLCCFLLGKKLKKVQKTTSKS